MRDIIEQVVDECVNEASIMDYLALIVDICVELGIRDFLEEKEKDPNNPPDYEYTQYEAPMSKP